MKLATLWAIARMELLLSWRRRLPVLGALLPVVTVILTVTLILPTVVEQDTDLFQPEVRSSALAFGWPTVHLLGIFVLSALTAPTLAADREFGATSWLFSLPVSGWSYLLGKALGVLLAVAAAFGGGMALYVLIFSLFHQPNAPLGDLHLLIVGGLPIVLWGALLGVLVGFFCGRRATAILLGLAVGFGGLFLRARLAEVLLPGQIYDSGSSWVLANNFMNLFTYHPLSVHVLANYGWHNEIYQPLTLSQALPLEGVVFAALAGLFLLVRLILWRRENV